MIPFHVNDIYETGELLVVDNISIFLAALVSVHHPPSVLSILRTYFAENTAHSFIDPHVDLWFILLDARV
jgi:hypothetical protein